MIVRFDSLDRYEKPLMTICNPGSVKLQNGLISNVVGMIPETYDEEIVFNFNQLSELNFRVYNIPMDHTVLSPIADTHPSSMYRTLQNRRLLYLEDIGYFVITSITEGNSENIRYKDVQAKSCEVELENRNVPYISNGTYRFQDLLETLVATIPLWTIGSVDVSVADKYRTFEDVDTDLNCHAFMVDNMQEAYECIFTFDIMNRRINVSDQNNYAELTSIHLTGKDLIDSLEIEESSDDIYTAISVLGDEEFSIAPINPTGTNVIYNFDYYLSWMSSSLRSAVTAWKNTVSGYMESYYDKNLQYYQLLTQKTNLQLELDKITTRLTMYRRCRDNIVAEASTSSVEGYNSVIVGAGGEAIPVSDDVAATIAAIDDLIAAEDYQYQTASTSLDGVQTQIDAIGEEINDIHDACAIDSAFTAEQQEELQNYIYEGNYTDEYVTATSIMTYEERFAQMKVLYDRAYANLQKVSVPTQQFSIDVENFVFIKAFQHFTDQLATGKIINVEIGDNDIAELFLTNITINYADRDLSLTFGNRFNKFDTKSLFDNALGSIQKTSNTLNYIKDAIYPIKDGEFNAMQDAINNSRTLTKGSALASDGQEVVIDDTGYMGRKMLESGEYDPHQVKITNKNIVFTTDAWETCSTALGDLILGDGESVYGVNAQAIIGDLIMGNKLRILDNEGNDLLTVVDGKIATRVDEVSGELGERMTNIEQTATDIQIRISTLGDPDHVTTTTGYTFNEDGLHIKKSGEEIENKIDNTGMYVNRGEDNVLTANAEGVNAINLTANQYLIIGGNSRFESYYTANNERRTACYFVD